MFLALTQENNKENKKTQLEQLTDAQLQYNNKDIIIQPFRSGLFIRARVLQEGIEK